MTSLFSLHFNENFRQEQFSRSGKLSQLLGHCRSRSYNEKTVIADMADALQKEIQKLHQQYLTKHDRVTDFSGTNQELLAEIEQILRSFKVPLGIVHKPYMSASFFKNGALNQVIELLPRRELHHNLCIMVITLLRSLNFVNITLVNPGSQDRLFHVSADTVLHIRTVILNPNLIEGPNQELELTLPGELYFQWAELCDVRLADNPSTIHPLSTFRPLLHSNDFIYNTESRIALIEQITDDPYLASTLISDLKQVISLSAHDSPMVQPWGELLFYANMKCIKLKLDINQMISHHIMTNLSATSHENGKVAVFQLGDLSNRRYNHIGFHSYFIENSYDAMNLMSILNFSNSNRILHHHIARINNLDQALTQAILDPSTRNHATRLIETFIRHLYADAKTISSPKLIRDGLQAKYFTLIQCKPNATRQSVMNFIAKIYLSIYDKIGMLDIPHQVKFLEFYDQNHQGSATEGHRFSAEALATHLKTLQDYFNWFMADIAEEERTVDTLKLRLKLIPSYENIFIKKLNDMLKEPDLEHIQEVLDEISHLTTGRPAIEAQPAPQEEQEIPVPAQNSLVPAKKPITRDMHRIAVQNQNYAEQLLVNKLEILAKLKNRMSNLDHITDFVITYKRNAEKGNHTLYHLLSSLLSNPKRRASYEGKLELHCLSRTLLTTIRDLFDPQTQLFNQDRYDAFLEGSESVMDNIEGERKKVEANVHQLNFRLETATLEAENLRLELDEKTPSWPQNPVPLVNCYQYELVLTARNTHKDQNIAQRTHSTTNHL